MDINLADVIIKRLLEKNPKGITTGEIKDIYRNFDTQGWLLTIRHLMDENFVIWRAMDYYKLDPSRIVEIKEFGSYSAYLQSKEESKKLKSDSETLAFKKLNYDAKLSKWQVKTFWSVFIFGLVGGCLGIASFVMQVLPKDKPQEKATQSVQKSDSTKMTKQAVFKAVK